jgi:lipopolysaccharide transport system permease protein
LGLAVQNIGERAIAGSASLPPADLPVVRIRPTKGWVPLNLRELIDTRELLYFFVWRDLKVRYKQTALGATWAIIQPLMTMLVFTVFLGNLAKVPSDGIPYPLFSFVALVPWTFFANGLGTASNSLVGNAHMITKVYFPRFIIPLATILATLVDFAFAFGMLLVLMGYFHATGLYPIHLTTNLLFLPFFLVLAFVTALGVGLWLSALNVRYRDVKYVIPFLTQFWMFATPVAYASSMLKEPWRTVYGINPMAGVIEGFRWSMLGVNTPPGPMILVSTIGAIVICISGAFYFRRMEKTFADVV